MKILQLSDLHGVDPSDKIGNIDPLKQLKKAVEHINHYHSNASFCAVTGDIADTASPLAYKSAKKLLDTLTMPYYPIVGNHDSRQPFLAEFTNTPTDNGFINYRVDSDNNVFLFLDTLKENHHDGELCNQRRQWLQNQLEQIGSDKQIVIFMHHPPFSVMMPWMDGIMLKNNQAFYDIIKDRQIAYLFFGHIHRPASGSWNNIPYASSRSIGHYQISPHNEEGFDFPMNQESPMYSVIHLSDNQIHIDMIDFLNDKVVYQT